ncbi:MAG: hypothetical protein ACSHX9_08470 [Luteolibacter sp.]
MKIIFVISGFVIFFFILIFEVNSNRFEPVPTGLYLFPLACLLAATFWKSPEKDNNYYYYAEKVYALLADGNHSIESILEKANVGYHHGDQASSHMTKTVIRMIEEGNLTIIDGKVCLSPEKFGTSTSAS